MKRTRVTNVLIESEESKVVGSCFIDLKPIGCCYKRTLDEIPVTFEVTDSSSHIWSLNKLYWMDRARSEVIIASLKDTLSSFATKPGNEENDAESSPEYASDGSSEAILNTKKVKIEHNIERLLDSNDLQFSAARLPPSLKTFAYQGVAIPPSTDELNFNLYHMLMSGFSDGRSKRFFKTLYCHFFDMLKSRNNNVFENLQFCAMHTSNENKDKSQDKVFPNFVVREEGKLRCRSKYADFVVTSKRAHFKAQPDNIIFCIEIKSESGRPSREVKNQLKVQLLSALATHRNVKYISIGGMLLLPNSFMFMTCQQNFGDKLIYMYESEVIDFSEDPSKLYIAVDVLYQYLEYTMERRQRKLNAMGEFDDGGL